MFIKIFTKKLNMVLSLIILSVLSAMLLGTPLALAAEAVKIPSGTVILVNPATEISPNTSNVGDKVNFTVINDVKINGNTLIKAGAPATGEVTTATKKGNIGAPAKIGISLKLVQAIDGTWIPINGSKMVQGDSKQTESIAVSLLRCVFALFMKGKDASITPSMQIDATVLSEATVTI
jgi:hypothetical protein